MIKRNYFISYTAHNSDNPSDLYKGYMHFSRTSLFDESEEALKCHADYIKELTLEKGYDFVHIESFNRC